MVKEKTRGGRWSLHKTEVKENKLRRLLELIKMLSTSKVSIETMAERLDCNQRTIYRYLTMFDHMGIDIDCTPSRLYFIAHDNCPICGREHNHQQPKDNQERSTHN